MRLGRGLSVLLGALALAGPAQAATINVTTDNDEYGGGPGTGCALREAIEAANTDEPFGGCRRGDGADTIRVPAGTFKIEIESFSSDIPNPPGEGDLNVTSPMTINGAGRNATKLDGANLDRLFYVEAGTERVTFSKLTVQHGQPGNPSMRYGGGIHAGSPVTITNVRFFDNHGSVGGGLYSSAPVVLRDSVFSQNLADLSSGGGANLFYGGTIANTTFSDNQAPSGSGGGLYGSQRPTRAHRVVVQGNEAFEGGGIGVANAKLVLTDSVVSGNEATSSSSGEQGGGIYTLSSNVTLRNSSIRGNSADNSGGGLHTEGGRIVLDRVVVAGNSTDGFGGGLRAAYFDPAAANTVRIERTTFRENRAGFFGGAIHLLGNFGGAQNFPVSIERSLIARNRAGKPAPENEFVGSGDGIMNQAVLTLTNSTVTGNKDPRGQGFGGGLSNTQFGTADLRNVTFTKNRAAPGGPNGDNVYNQGVLRARSSIVGGASATGNCAEITPITSRGHNLEFETGGNRCFDRPNDRVGNARLGRLANNGGPTHTLALRPGSDALGHGAACLGVDQRGAPRALGGRCDIGAYELVRCEGVVVNRVGTSGLDRLRGTRRADGLLGLGGRDRLLGLGGPDGLCGGGGPDVLVGGAGDDVCSGGPGTDGATGCERRISVP